MEALHRPDPHGTPPPAPSTRAVIALLVLAALLMIFSVVMWLLGNPTLTATAAAGAIALIADIARRLLATLSAPGTSADPPAGLAPRDARPAAGPPAVAGGHEAAGTGQTSGPIERAA